MSAPLHDLDAIRQALPLAGLIGGDVTWARKSRPQAGDYWASCPFHAEASPSFHVVDRPGQSFFHCFGCRIKGGSVFDYIMARDGCAFGEAVRRCADLAGIEPGAGGMPADAEARVAERARNEERARARQTGQRERAIARAAGMWRAARPDPSVGVYLTARGIDLDALGGVPASLRHGHVYHSDVLRQSPAMIAPIQQADGVLTAVHCTCLTPDGRAKIAVDPAKRMWGPAWGGAIRLGPAAPRMGLAEGIETALAFMAEERRAGRETVCWAAGSLGNIAGHADRSPAGVTMPPECRHVTIVADNDTKHRRTLDEALEAASLRLGRGGCGVDVVMPPRGMDFLDWTNSLKGRR